MKVLLNLEDQLAITQMEYLIAKIKSGKCLSVNTTTKRTSVKADFGAVCTETHLGDTVTLSISVVTQLEIEK